MAYERAFVAAGGLLAAGVDPTGNGGALPGYGDQRNFELLSEAGFTPEQVVQIMSLNGARILGVDKDLGTVEKGKLADLVVVRGDLAGDPAAIKQAVTVFRAGIGCDSPPRSISSCSASSSATTSRSLGRPAARFTWISHGRSSSCTSRPKSVIVTACGKRSSYRPPPTISPSRSIAPAVVVRAKFKPARSVAADQANGNPGGAPRR